VYHYQQPLIFLCSGAAKSSNKKLSHRIADHLASIGFGEIGTLEDLSRQHATEASVQRRMIFINDCKSGCVKVLTHGFDEKNYVFFDISPLRAVEDLDIGRYVSAEMLPLLNEKWKVTIS